MSNIKADLGNLREEYMSRPLSRADMDPDPLVQFDAWFGEARDAGEPDVNAMCLATVSPSGQPAARTVLLKYFDDKGFVFYTNYGSRKAREMDAQPRVALLFHWTSVHRQVCITGQATRIAASQSMKYFLSRPHGSQLGAWVSEQSQVIASRAVLEHALNDVKARFAEGKVPLPSFWGGYRVAHKTIEFWQGRRNRLHDRLQYRRDDNDTWLIERLAP